MNPYDFAVNVVVAAGEKLLAARPRLEVGHKGGDERDVLTSADLEINTFLIQQIQEAFPGHGVASEEGGGGEAAGEYQWLIDPIDGSANFARALPHFAVCVGLLHRGVPIVGAVYNPTTRELFSFEKGKGAFLNGAPIAASGVIELADAQALFSHSRVPAMREWAAQILHMLMGSVKKTKNFGASALDLCFLAAGRVDVVIYGTLSAKDIAAAVSIVREAGGEVYTLDGKPAEFLDKPQTIVATANKELLNQIRPLLRADLLPQ